jgi:LPS-assembly protein
MVTFGNMRRLARILLCGGLLAVATAAAAQTGPLPGMDAARQRSIKRLADNHWQLTDAVEIERDGVRLFADEIEYFTDTYRVIATGNVVFATESHRIAADSADFNLQTKLGTFVHASGSATLGEGKPPSSFGAQEPDIYFYGKTVEKIGDQKYRISDGGFTACVQPKPRWELTSGTVILNLDHYALLLNPIMRVKGVPVFYMPVIYYPISNDDRSTGFLLPVYGTSTLRGHTVSNAFFWAMGRSHDATFVHDWFSNTGQGYGAEYRYVASAASLGDARFYVVREKPTEMTNSSGTVSSSAGRQGFELRGNVSQGLPFRLRARGRVDYFSNIEIQQNYSQNLYAASLRQRYYGGNIAGAWGAYAVNASVDRSELFYSATSSITAANRPRLSFGRAERPVWRTPFYAALGAEFVSLARETTSGKTITALDIKRVDVTPTLRLPFRRWPFLTVNSSASWRFTRWNKSQGPGSTILEEPVSRSFFELRSRIVGPVFSRIWNTNSGYAEKIKHTIEPNLMVDRVTSFDTFSRIVKLDGVDYTIGGSTRFTYGLENRIYAKRPVKGRQGQAREVFSVVVRQTYYTDEKASAVDGSYQSGFTVQLAAPSKFSPISIQARATPLTGLAADLRVEYDKQIETIKTLGLSGSVALRNWVIVSGAWNKQRYFFDVNNPAKISSEYQFISGGSSLRLLGGRVGGDLSFNYDVTREVMMQRRVTGFYNIQCCGIAVEYQVYDFSGYGSFVVPKDKRFNISLTLAGLGTFSNFLGAFGAGGATR